MVFLYDNYINKGSKGLILFPLDILHWLVASNVYYEKPNKFHKATEMKLFYS